MKRILVAVDFSSHSMAAAGLGVAIANARGAKVALFNAVERFDHTLIPNVMANKMAADAVLQCQRDLDSMASELSVGGTEITALSRHVNPVRGILGYALEWNADMIVLGTRGEGARDREWFGSVASGVAQSASCPVLITRHEHTGRYPSDGVFDHTLIAIDYSKFSVPAIRLAAQLTRKSAVLEMVHIYYAPEFGDLEGYDNAIAEARVAELDKLEELAGRVDLAPWKVSMYTGAGQVARQLLDYAAASKTDLIIAGAHGEKDSKEKLGTVAERLISYAPTPVLVLPERALETDT
jgi:nucleotide-binding universal stress UspA family protein